MQLIVIVYIQFYITNFRYTPSFHVLSTHKCLGWFLLGQLQINWRRKELKQKDEDIRSRKKLKIDNKRKRRPKCFSKNGWVNRMCNVNLKFYVIFIFFIPENTFMFKNFCGCFFTLNMKNSKCFNCLKIFWFRHARSASRSSSKQQSPHWEETCITKLLCFYKEFTFLFSNPFETMMMIHASFRGLNVFILCEAMASNLAVYWLINFITLYPSAIHL